MSFQIGEEVIVYVDYNSAKYEGTARFKGKVLAARPFGFVKVELYNTGSQDSEGYNAIATVHEKHLRKIRKGKDGYVKVPAKTWSNIEARFAEKDAKIIELDHAHGCYVELCERLKEENKAFRDVIEKVLKQCGSLHKPIYFLWLNDVLEKYPTNVQHPEKTS